MRKLFDDIKRTRTKSAGRTESRFSFVNESAWPASERIRALLEDWYTSIPPENRFDLLQRFRSYDDTQHFSAFFELYCIGLIKAHGFRAEYHKRINTKSKKVPDWFASESETGTGFYLEATVCYDKKTIMSLNTNKSQIIDYIDDNVESPYFFLQISFLHEGNGTPPLSRIAKSVSEKLSTVNYGEVVNQIKKKGNDFLPKFVVRITDWEIEIQLSPKKKSSIGSSHHRTIGSEFSGAKSIDLCTSIFNSLSKKAKRYTDLKHPYLIALNSIQEFPVGGDEIDIMQALFGDEQYTISIQSKEMQCTRKPNGLWCGPEGPRNTRVSAVLFVDSLKPATVARQTPILYHNPFAKRPFPCSKFQVEQRIPYEGKMKKAEGLAVHRLLNLHPEWPYKGF